MKYKDFRYIANNNEITITSYIGDDTDVVIPSEINGNPVKSICAGAFSYCESLTSITIPDGVEKIRDFTFSYCESLTSITIPDGVTSIGDNAFSRCGSLTSVTIGNSVTSIGDNAFYGCTSLKNITIPDSVREIGGYAFYGCISLKSQPTNYKAFRLQDNKLMCRDYKYTLNEWSEEVEPMIYKQGYHFCTNIFDIFNYYYGEYGKDFVIGICEVGDKTTTTSNDSKCVTNKINPVKILSKEEVIDIVNGKEYQKTLMK